MQEARAVAVGIYELALDDIYLDWKKLESNVISL